MIQPRRPRQRQTAISPESARLRRMSTYPGEMLLIIKAAMDKQDYRKRCRDWNEAVAFLARYYKFRMDAIESGLGGALLLRDMQARGTNLATGMNLRSNYPEEGEYELTWHWTGGEELFEAVTQELGINNSAARAPEQQDPGEELLQQTMQSYDRPKIETTPERQAELKKFNEQQLREANIRHAEFVKSVTDTMKANAREQYNAQRREKRAADSAGAAEAADAELPGFDEKLKKADEELKSMIGKDLAVSPCPPHEWDALETHCTKCKVPFAG